MQEPNDDNMARVILRVHITSGGYIEARYLLFDFRKKQLVLKERGDTCAWIHEKEGKQWVDFEDIKGIYCNAGEVTFPHDTDTVRVEFERRDEWIVAHSVEIDFEYRTVLLSDVVAHKAASECVKQILENKETIEFSPEIDPIKSNLKLPFEPNEERIEMEEFE